MYYVCRPAKVAIYINKQRKSMSAIQRELGCDAIINGGLFDMSAFTPNCWLRADGQTLHMENWTDWGFGWDDAALTLDTSANIRQYRNFISCLCVLRNGEVPILYYPKEIGGRRGRTAIGTRADGSVVLYCTQDGGAYASTPEELQAELKTLGCVSALMLDGGGSSQCITPIGNIQSQRIVQNYIAVWLEAPAEKPKDECPYPEPHFNVRWGSLGNPAKWVQWQLRRHGILIDVDGLFFGQSVSALRSFQVAHGLTADGVCGPLTREELKA